MLDSYKTGGLAVDTVWRMLRTLLCCFLLMPACATPRIERTSAVTTDPKAAARHFYARLEMAIHTDNVSLLDDLMLPDVVDHNPDPNMKPERAGRPISYSVIDILRFTPDGRLIERWGLVDDATLRQQLSAGPATSP
ncbi:hypothetical protein DRW03_12805 [Corallococcus sp. H22C18031201]|nr:hypothetical protein DRW03_12805 [Corallococcus sp. H22C18031201]